MNQHSGFRRRAAVLGLVSVMASVGAAGDVVPPVEDVALGHYSFRQASLDGIGKVYMGRETSGIPWFLVEGSVRAVRV